MWTKAACMSSLTLVLWSFTFSGSCAQGLPKEVGVFPIIKGNDVQGTAFLIEPKYGWLLTAAHVLSRCKTATNEPIQIQIVSVCSAGHKRFAITNLVSLKPLLYGYDFTLASAEQTNEGSIKDWALLTLVNSKDAVRFNIFRPLKVDPAVNGPKMRAMARAPESTGKIAVRGFRDKVVTAERFPCELAENDADPATGLWKMTAKSTSGLSGGPCEVNDIVLGIVLKNASGTSYTGRAIPQGDTCNINPIYSILPEIASRLPPTEAVEACASYFRTTSDDSGAEQALLALYEVIDSLDAIEQWQLLKVVCSATRSSRQKFIFDYFCDYIDDNSWMIRNVVGCLPNEEITALLMENGRISTSVQASGLAQLRESVKAANVLGSLVLEDLPVLKERLIDETQLAQATLDAVYLRNVYYGLPETEPTNMVALAWARSKLGNSVQIPVSYLAACKEILPAQKDQLAEYAVLLGAEQSQTTGPSALQIGTNIATQIVGAVKATKLAGNVLALSEAGKLSIAIHSHPGGAVLQALDAKDWIQ